MTPEIDPLLISVCCPLCGADDCRIRYPATISTAEERTPDQFRCTSHRLGKHGDIVSCRVCGMVYNNPQPRPELLLGMYQNVEDPLYLEEADARVRTYRHSLRDVEKIAAPPGNLLDVGCYTGVFMQVAAESGWDVTGVELSAWAAAIAAETGCGKVYNLPLDLAPLPEEAYDVITLWDVMEHLATPHDLLSRVHRLLKPGGILALSTHMQDSLAVRLMGTRYPFFMEMHVVHFSRNTIQKILEANGFTLIRIAPHRRILRTGYFLEKLGHKITLPPLSFLIRWLSGQSWLRKKFIHVGMLGLANIVARKTGQSASVRS